MNKTNNDFQSFSDSQLLALRGTLDGMNAGAYAQKTSSDLAVASTNADLISTVAKHASENEWVNFLRHGTMPEILPLESHQMEALHGGKPAYNKFDHPSLAGFVWYLLTGDIN